VEAGIGMFTLRSAILSWSNFDIPSIHFNMVHSPPPLLPGASPYKIVTDKRFMSRAARGGNSRSTNGTVTLRHSSTIPYAKSTAEEQSSEQASQFFKNLLLEGLGASQGDVSDLYTGNWDPEHTNGSGATNGRGWGLGKSDGRDDHNPDITWDGNGSVQPSSLDEMNDLVSLSINFLRLVKLTSEDIQ